MKVNKWFKIVPSIENKNVVYFEFEDGLRLIVKEGKYDGWYVCK